MKVPRACDRDTADEQSLISRFVTCDLVLPWRIKSVDAASLDKAIALAAEYTADHIEEALRCVR